ncbi:MAG: class I SAM-dependent methyltransferase [Acidimicrobiales bacterium]
MGKEPAGPNVDAQRTAAQYDAMAGPYADYNAVNAANACYERPATIALLGDVSDKAVLEIGCGPGSLTEWMVERGAHVTAFDVSEEMVNLASARVNGRATIFRADLHEPLSFATDGQFDVVVASLVLHYLRDWEPVLTEMQRVLAREGRVIFSTHHPAWDWGDHSPEDYFALKQVTETWIRAGQPFEVTFWRRPLRAMTKAIRAAGLVIEDLTEPEPLAELAGTDPVAYHELQTRPFFLFFCLRRRTDA